MNFFDIIVLVIVLLGAIQGYRKGLISGLISLGGAMLGLIIAAKNYGTLFTWLEENTPLRGWLETGIYKRMLSSLEAKAELIQEQTLEKLLSMFPEEFRSILGGANLPDMQVYTDSVLQSIALNFTQALTDSTLKIISFALVYFGVIIVLEIISAIVLAPLGLFTDAVNGGGGFLVGGFVAFLGSAIFVGLFSPLLSVVNPGETIGFLEESKMYPYLEQTFAVLGNFLRINFEQGFNLPLDLQELNYPIEIKDFLPSDPHSIDL